jgi:glycosyltransferase involved in cell wall biosynthesis
VTSPAFTILLPVHRPPALLPYAIASVQAQERQDFELFVICEGAPPETAAVARRHAAADARIRVFEHPKGERHGELYRHQALQEARGDYVCHISDDDLWLPNYLSEMGALLREVDFGNLAHVQIAADGAVSMLPGTLADAEARRTMIVDGFNFFGLSFGGYRLSTYRTLPVGWSPAPPDLPTDLFMWRKFLTRDGLKFGTRTVVAAVKFAEVRRRDWPLERRRAEIAAWAEQLADRERRDATTQMAIGHLSAVAFRLDHQVRHMSWAAGQSAARIDAMQAQLQEARGRLHASTLRSAKLDQKLKKTRRSWSWRLTRPFRWLARKIAR